MKIIYAFLLLANASVIATGQSTPTMQDEQAKPPFTLTISYDHSSLNAETTADQVVEPGLWAAFRIRKTNISDQEIPVSLHGCRLRYDLRDGSGNPVPHAKPTRGMSGGVNTSGSIQGPPPGSMLQSGESKITFEPIASWYEMDKPGTYLIQASQCVSDDPASEVVKSNILRITVVAPAPPAEKTN